MIVNRILQRITHILVPQSQRMPCLASFGQIAYPRYYFSEKVKDHDAKEPNQQPHKKPFNKFKKSKSRVFSSQANQGNKDRQSSELSNVIKAYRVSKAAKQDGHNAIYAECCKRIASLYRKQTHSLFVEHRQQLQKLLKVIPDLDYGSIELTQLLNVLDFLRISSRIETIHRSSSYEFSRDAVFSIITKYLKEITDTPINELLILFCKLTPLYYPEIATISSKIYEQLQAEFDQHGKLPLLIYQHFVTIKSLSKKEFLSYPDKRILQLVINDLSRREKQIDKGLWTQLAKAFIDLDVPSTLANYRSLDFFNRFLDFAVVKSEKSQGTDYIMYLLECKINDFPQHRKIVEIIYNKIIQRMGVVDLNAYPFTPLIHSLRHLNVELLSKQDKLTVLSRVADVFEKGNYQARKKLQIDLADLIETRFFVEVAQQLNQIVGNPNFEFNWTLPYHYSLVGMSFPHHKIIEKGERAYQFREDSNFLKAAVAIAKQARLQPQNAQLAEFYKNTIERIQTAKWQQGDWLVKTSLYHPRLVQEFHRQYSHLYTKYIYPSEKDLKIDELTKFGEKIKYLSYWEYLYLVTQVDNALPPQFLTKTSLAVCLLCISKQCNKINAPVHGKNALLASIYSKLCTGFEQCSKKQQEICLTYTLNILCFYFELLYRGTDTFIELYTRTTLELIRHYEIIRKKALPQANFLLMKLLAIKSPKILHSSWIKEIIRQILSSPTIFSGESQHEHVKTAIVRAALHHNLLSYLNMPKFTSGYFSEHQSNLLNTLVGKHRITSVDHQNLVLLLKNINITEATLKSYLAEIDGLILSASLSQLEQYLIHFSLERSKSSNFLLAKIVEQFNNKLVATDVDFMRIIANVHKTLSETNPPVLLNLLANIGRQLSTNFSALLLVDHYQFLCFLNKYKVSVPAYTSNLLEYAINTKQRGSFIVDIAYELSRNEEVGSLDFNLLSNYSLLSPDNYLKLLVSCEASIPNTQQLLVKLSENQIISVADSIITRYLQSKYQIKLRKQLKEQPMLLNATLGTLELINSLQKHAVPVTIEEIGRDKVYLLGSHVVLAVTDRSRTIETNLVVKALNFLYPKRQLALADPEGDRRRAHQLFNEMRTNLSLSASEGQSIARELSES